jgi:hypothetical protein
MTGEERRENAYLLGLVLAPALPLLAYTFAPALSLGAYGPLFTFAGGVLTGLLPIAIATRAPQSPRVSMAIGGLAALALLGALIASPSGIGGVVLVDAALVGIAYALGGSLGRRVADPGHLLPACIVAAVADTVSVLHPAGPTHAIVASERALSLLAVSFPVAGARAVSPVLGVGDLLFIALVLGVAAAHRLSIRRVFLAALVGVAAAGALSMLLSAAVPAIVTIAAAVIAFVPEARRLRTEDRRTSLIAIVIVFSVAGGLALQRLFERWTATR